MPRSLRDEDKIVERVESPALSKRALIILGGVIYVLGIVSGMRVGSMLGVGVCPTSPVGSATMPAPRAVEPMPLPQGGTPAVPLPVPEPRPKAAPARLPDAAATSPPASAAPASPAVTPPASVATPPPAVVPSTPGQAYAIQVKSFPDLEEAGDLARLLKERGFPAFVVSATVPDKGEVHRVRVGDYPTRAAAERAATELQNKTGFASFVTVSLD
jgi:DedD protein